MKRSITQLFILGLLISLSSCKKDADPPSASFTVESSTVSVGEEVSFTNTSSNATDYEWNFGDGSNSSQENPTHSYSETGTFTVTLTATGEGGDDSFTMTITVEGTLTGTWNKDFVFI